MLDGRYRILKLLGEGGMGVVYQVHDEYMGDVLALKILQPDRLRDEVRALLVSTEARTGWSLNKMGILHPNLVRTLDVGRWRLPGTQQEAPYFVMEYVEGQSLSDWLASFGDGLPDPGDVLSYVEQIADGIARAHEVGILHRDLKPGNVMIEHAGNTAKVTDFGIAVWQARDPGLTVAQEYSTVQWAAPEQLETDGREGHHTDVYSLGKILYYLLSGRYYDGQYYRPVGGARHLPHAVDHLIRRACAGNVEDRLPDMNAFLEALRPVRERYRELAASGTEDEEGDPEVIQARERRILVLKGQYREHQEKGSPWQVREPVLQELQTLGADDSEIRAWRDEWAAFRRHELQETLDAACRNLDGEGFIKAFKEAVNLLPAGAILEWRIRFAERHAESLSATGRHREAIDLLRSLILDAELSKPQRRALLNRLLASAVKAERARLEANMVASDGDTKAASPAADAEEGAASEKRNARIDALYAEVRSLMARGDRESAAQAAIRERLNELRMLQKVEADAMRRRFEARLFLPPGAGREALRNARRLLAKDADPASEHDSAVHSD